MTGPITGLRYPDAASIQGAGQDATARAAAATAQATADAALPATGAATADYTGGATGGVARTPRSKGGDLLYAEDFGAVGDGVANDTAKLQAGLDHLGGAGGGDLRLRRGRTYKVSALTLPSLVSLVGTGHLGKAATSPARLLASAAGTVLSMNSGASNATLYGQQLRGFEIDCNNVATLGIDIYRSIMCKLEDVKVINSAADGIKIDHSWTSTFLRVASMLHAGRALYVTQIPNALTFIACTFSQSPNGVVIDATGSSGGPMTFDTCDIESCTTAGLTADNVWALTIRNCYWENLSGCTDVILGSSVTCEMVSLVHNMFSAQAGVVNGIDLYRCAGLLIQGNRWGSNYGTNPINNRATSVSGAFARANRTANGTGLLSSTTGFVDSEAVIAALPHQRTVRDVQEDRYRASAGQTLMRFFVGSEANQRWDLLSNGQQDWGPGSATAPDTQLVRAAAGILAVRDSSSVERDRLGGIITTTTAALTSSANAVNTAGKWQWKGVGNSTDGKAYLSNGTGTTSTWTSFDGATTQTPVP